MNNISILGISESSLPLSEAFSVANLNKVISLDKLISSIVKISLSIDCNYIDEFNSLSKNFINILISINIRIDYLCSENKLNTHLVNLQESINICTGQNKYNKNSGLYSQIFDADVVNIEQNLINIYILYMCSLDL